MPLETGGGSGTGGIDWSEAVFGNEIMTGFIGSAPDPLSILTNATLRDLDYSVNCAAADADAMPGAQRLGHAVDRQRRDGGTTITQSSGGTAWNTLLADAGAADSAWYGLIGGLAEVRTFAPLHEDDDDDEVLPSHA